MQFRADWAIGASAVTLWESGRAWLWIGLGVAAVLVAAMLVLRIIGQRIVAADPHIRSWRSVIGRVLAKTSIAFMVIAAIDIVAGYADPPARLARILDIAFVIAAAIQAAVLLN